MRIRIKEELTTDVYHAIVDEELKTDERILRIGEILEVENFDADDESWGFELKDGSIVYLPIESFSIL